MMSSNPVRFFEIPAVNLDRAVRFYEAVFAVTLERVDVDGNAMAMFPGDPARPGASGAIACGESYVPSRDGTRVYFGVADIDAALERVRAAGGAELYPKTSIGEWGWVAEFQDSEGNRVALHQAAS
jgi:predicted enzyme related to lactoylglutathione lyase